MKVIPIDITNACMFSCSNCTRFCGHQQKPTYMTFETFKQVVDSMVGFPGIVGIIGGEPTLHPEFERFIEYYASKIPETGPRSFFRLPVKSFTEYSKVLKYQRGRHRGLFTSLGAKYYEHFELIQDVFPYQSINDHQNVCLHQALMITRKELGIPDQKWHELRDACWIQNVWSAGVTHKGAFFCEIAAHLDLLFDGPGGWPIEPGWWKRKPEDFGDQLGWCEYCSAALPVPRVDGRQERDIISPLMLEKLKAIDSPKVRKGKYILFDPSTYDSTKYKGNKKDPIWYLPDDQRDAARVSTTNTTLEPRYLNLLVMEDPKNLPPLPNWVSLLTRDAYESGGFPDWAMILKQGAFLDPKFLEAFHDCVLNPGGLYAVGCIKRIGRLDPTEIFDRAKILLFNRRARALRGKAVLPLGAELINCWDPRKRLLINSYPNLSAKNFHNRISILFDQFVHKSAFFHTWNTNY
jgi:hypothetical protein